MPFTIPNEADAFHPDQAEPDRVDVDILVTGISGDGVVSGCEVSAIPSGMSVQVAAGIIAVDGAIISIDAGTLLVSTPATDPRFDLVVAHPDSGSQLSIVEGIPHDDPVFPDVPAGAVALAAVYVPVDVDAIDDELIIDKRVIVRNPTEKEDAGIAAALMIVHESESDPHSQYLLVASSSYARSGANTDITSIYLNNTGLKIKDTNASHGLTIAPGSDLTADRTLSLVTGDAARTITLTGNPTLNDWFDQSVKVAATPTFAGLTVTGAFTSLGIDDNATAEVMQLEDTLATMGQSGSSFTFVRNVNDQVFGFSAGTAANSGPNILMAGDGHATLANDIAFRVGTTNRFYWDNSADMLTITADVLTLAGGGGDGVANIAREVNNSALDIWGGISAGGRLSLLGSTHLILPNWAVLQGDTIILEATDGTDRMTLASTGVRVTPPFGYATGAGGTVTQLTSKSTGVTLNKVCGAITMHNAALAANTIVSFTLTNNTIAVGDTVYVIHSSGGTAAAYIPWANNVAAGSCQISVRNMTAGSLSQAIVLTFFVLKGVTA